MPQQRREHLVDARDREPGTALGDVPDDVVHAEDVDGRDPGVHPPLAGEGGDRVHLVRCEARVGEGGFGRVGEVGEPGDVVGDVLLAAGDPVAVDCDLAPRLRVDDEDAAAADDDHVDLGRRAAGPSSVGEQVVADAGERGEDPGGLALGALGDLEPLGSSFGVVGLASVCVGEAALAAGLEACGFPGHRHGAFPGDPVRCSVRRPWARGAEPSSWISGA